MTKEIKRGGSRLLRVMIAVLVSIAFFAHMGLNFNVQAAEYEGVLYWRPSAPTATVPGGSDQVTLSFTMTGDASIVPYVIGVSFSLAHPDTEWTFVSVQGLDSFPPTAVSYLAGVGYMITGNQYAPIQPGHVVTVTLLIPEGVESFDLNVIGTFEVEFEDGSFVRIGQPGPYVPPIPPVSMVRCACDYYCDDCGACEECGICDCQEPCDCVECAECGECVYCGECECEEPCDCVYCEECDYCVYCGECDCYDPAQCCEDYPDCDCDVDCDCEPCPGCCVCECECPVICDCEPCDCECDCVPCECDCDCVPCECEPCDCDCCDCDDNGNGGGGGAAGGGGAPQTGDTTNHAGILMSLAMSAGAALLTVKHLKKKGRL